MSPYNVILSPGLQSAVAEKSNDYKHLSERHLQAIWFESKYFKNLTNAEGLPVEIISPGIWNAEAGPDFCKAHIRIGKEEMRGDVEIHFNDDQWMQHGHHKDERYDNVILHVSLWNPINAKTLLNSKGKVLHQTYLEKSITVPHGRLLQLIDLDLYPYKKFVGSGRCAHLLFRYLSEEKITTFLRIAADWRLRQKRAYLQAHYSEPSLQFGIGIARALGYKNNAEAFSNVFNWLYELSIPDEELRLALAMRACGFFQAPFLEKWKNSAKYDHLRNLSQSMSEVPSFKLILNQIRPFNHPIRRLVILSKIVSKPTLSNLYNQLIAHWEQSWNLPPVKGTRNNLFEQFCTLLHIPDDDIYWNRHFLFETNPKQEFVAFLGDDMKLKIFVNAFFPLLQEHIEKKGSIEEVQTFQDLYFSLPAEKNSKTEYLTHRFFGDTPKGSVLKQAATEQGAYQIHRDFCIHFEASCEGCPFVERYKNLFL